MKPTRADIIDAARAYLDWGWGHQRRGPDRIDCVGLPIMVARRLALVPPDFNFTGYSRIADLPRLVGLFRQNMREKAKTHRLPGDLVVVRDTVFPCHCGILSELRGKPTMIHARGTMGTGGKGLHARGKVREERFGDEWVERMTHCFAFPGVADG